MRCNSAVRTLILALGLSLGSSFSIRAETFVHTDTDFDVFVDDSMRRTKKEKIAEAINPIGAHLERLINDLKFVRNNELYLDSKETFSASAQISQQKIYSQQLVDLFARHFGTITDEGTNQPRITERQLNHVIDNFESLRDQLIESSKLDIRYEGKGSQCSENTVAFVWMGKDEKGNPVKIDVHRGSFAEYGQVILYLCEAFFFTQGAERSVVKKTGTLVHELTHWFLNTEDYAYFGQIMYFTLSLRNRLHNADTYSTFFEGFIQLSETKPTLFSNILLPE